MAQRWYLVRQVLVTTSVSNRRSQIAPLPYPPSLKSFASLCFACLLHPTREELKAIFSKYPAVPQQIALELHNLAGGDVEVEIKKG
jgi:hypothetical protein